MSLQEGNKVKTERVLNGRFEGYFNTFLIERLIERFHRFFVSF